MSDVMQAAMVAACVLTVCLRLVPAASFIMPCANPFTAAQLTKLSLIPGIITLCDMIDCKQQCAA